MNAWGVRKARGQYKSTMPNRGLARYPLLWCAGCKCKMTHYVSKGQAKCRQCGLESEAPYEPVCVWKEDEDGIWWTACDNAQCFEVAGPKENGYKFCPYCGKPLKEKPCE